jgi:hypothetical protein
MRETQIAEFINDHACMCTSTCGAEQDRFTAAACAV